MRREGGGWINNSFRPENKQGRPSYLGGLFADASVVPSGDDLPVKSGTSSTENLDFVAK